VWRSPYGSVYREGDTMVFAAAVKGWLGPAAQSDDQWHVLYQLQGLTNGQWVPPVLSLEVRDGKLWVAGGHGHPNHDWTSRNYWWRRPIATWHNGQTYRIRLVSRLSSDPDKGRLNVYVDGVRKIGGWRPTSPSGLRPGTLYPGQPEVQSRSGLYRGTQGGVIPTYGQGVQVRLMEVGKLSLLTAAR